MRTFGYGLWIIILIFELFALLLVVHDYGSELSAILVPISAIIVTLVVGTVGMLSFKGKKSNKYENYRK